MRMMFLELVVLVASLLTPGSNAQAGCVQNNVQYLEAATYNSTTVDTCKLYCQNNLTCKYFTWNTQTQGCGIRTYNFGSYVDSPVLHTGTPFSSGYASNKAFVGKATRQTTIGQCAQGCLDNTLCNSWTWYTSNIVNSSNICVENYDQPTTQWSIPRPAGTVPSLYSGVKSCQSVTSGCSAVVNSNICCASSIPFVRNCGADQNGTSGTITSPNYPSAYGNGTACVWNINAPVDSSLSLSITSFLTDINDRLFILLPQSCNYANGTTSYLSGSQSPRTITIPQNTASLYFYTDANVTNSGFNINWYSSSTGSSNCTAFVNNNLYSTLAVNYPFVRNCGADQSGTSGLILSPNYPSAYPSSSFCLWNIDAPAGTTLTLNIAAFSIENSFDRVFILLPQNCSYAVGKYLTGNTAPQSLIVAQNTASIYFYTDPSVTYSGFNISWSASANCAAYVNNNTLTPDQSFVKNCGSSQTGLSGTILSPNYPNNYGNNDFCEWTISSPPGTNITLSLNAFATENGYDRLYILRPSSCSAMYPSIPFITGGLVALPSTGQNSVTIYFYSDNSVVSTGFNITWRAS